MAVGFRRVVGLVLVAALSGAPAVLAACATLCLAGMPAMAHTTPVAHPASTGVDAGHGTHETMGRTAEALHDRMAGHHHAEAHHAGASGHTAVRAFGADHSCCDGRTALTAGETPGRNEAAIRLLGVVTLVSPDLSMTSVRRDRGIAPRIAPPHPPGAPIVLRV